MLMAGPTTSGWHFYAWRRGIAYGTHAYRDLVQDDALIWTYPDGNPDDPINLAEGGLIIGQEQDSLGGGFQDSQAFSGKIDDLRVYNRALSTEELEILSESYNPIIQVADTQKGLIGYWKMDGNAKDSTPHENNGTVYGAILTTDRKEQSNKAYSFDGVDVYVDLGNKTDWKFSATDNFSICFWVKSTDHGDNNKILAKWSSGHWGNYSFETETDGDITFTTYTDVLNKGVISTAIQPLNGQWRYICGIRDVPNDKVLIYVDGGNMRSATDGSLDLNYSANLYIGKEYTVGYEFNGLIDDVRIYNRALNENEVKMLYESYQ
jgi:hypothetical protein